MSEMLATLDGASYIVRRSVHDPGNINRTKKAIKTAFQAQLNGLGFSLVEVLSACPVQLEPDTAEKPCTTLKRKWFPTIRWATSRWPKR